MPCRTLLKCFRLALNSSLFGGIRAIATIFINFPSLVYTIVRLRKVFLYNQEDASSPIRTRACKLSTWTFSIRFGKFANTASSIVSREIWNLHRPMQRQIYRQIRSTRQPTSSIVSSHEAKLSRIWLNLSKLIQLSENFNPTRWKRCL